MRADSIPLGKIIGERQFTVYTAEGVQRLITVRLGAPVATTSEGALLPEGAAATGTFRCPVQIMGVDQDEKIYGVFGEEQFVALQYAINLIGEQLNHGIARMSFTNRYPGHRLPDSWIWRYNSRPDEPI
jgi:hypothetical protein